MAHLTMDQAIAKLREEHPKYAPAAYHFIRRALDFSLRKLKRQDAERPAHVSGKELLEGFRDLALEEYGPLAKTVLEDWGITKCSEVGEVVFQLVSMGVLGKNEDDRIDDFGELWSFAEAFDLPFRPQSATIKSKRVSPRSGSLSPAHASPPRTGQATTPSEKE